MDKSTDASARVDDYIAKHSIWQDKMTRLREILRASELQEDVKWGGPCYTLAGKNVVGMAGFKQHMALWFHQGALLSDKQGVLINAQEGKTRALRQWRFGAEDKLPVRQVKAYIKEAIKLEQSGQRIKPTSAKTLVIPEELQAALNKTRRFGAAFDKLNPGVQREYADHISEAKRAETRLKRLEKIKPMILEGKALHDKYRK